MLCTLALATAQGVHEQEAIIAAGWSARPHRRRHRIRSQEGASDGSPGPATRQEEEIVAHTATQYKRISEIHGIEPKRTHLDNGCSGGASVIYADTVGDLGYASELGNYAEYSGAPNEEEVLQYARVILDCVTADPDGRKRALLIGGGIANFTDVAATFSGIIRALREKESKLKAARMNIYVRRGGPNYQTGLAKMRALGAELGVPIEVYGPEATMTGICKQAIDCIMAEA